MQGEVREGMLQSHASSGGVVAALPTHIREAGRGRLPSSKPVLLDFRFRSTLYTSRAQHGATSSNFPLRRLVLINLSVLFTYEWWMTSTLYLL